MIYDFEQYKDNKINDKNEKEWQDFLKNNPELKAAHTKMDLRRYNNFTGGMMCNVDELNKLLDEGIELSDLIGSFLFSSNFVNIGAAVATFIDFVDGSIHCEALRDNKYAEPKLQEFIKITKQYFDKFLEYHTGKK